MHRDQVAPAHAIGDVDVLELQRVHRRCVHRAGRLRVRRRAHRSSKTAWTESEISVTATISVMIAIDANVTSHQ